MKTIIVSFLLLVPLSVFSQVGINNSNPQAALDIKSSAMPSDTQTHDILTLRNSNGSTVFNIKDNGKVHTMGVNDTISSTLFDIRSTNLDGDIEGAIAIGNTTLQADEAGEGALKYNPDTKSFFLSNGTNWQELFHKPLRASSSVEPYQDSFVESGQTKIIKNWSIISDSYGSADPTTGLFTAPHDGIYGVFLNMIFKRTTINADSYIRTDIQSFQGGPPSYQDTQLLNLKNTSAYLITYPVATDEYPVIQTTNYFKLSKDDTVRVQLIHNIGNALEVLHQYTYMSIVEL